MCNKDYIYVVWKDVNTRRRYVVGQITKDEGYEFSYIDEIDQAILAGFTLLVAFPEKDNKYKCNTLFPAFSSRLPDSKRKDINSILEKYDMDVYDEYELLKKSGARLPIDELEFIDPILTDDFHGLKRKFYLAGSRHYLGCKGENCENVKDSICAEGIRLEIESDNKEDVNAIKVVNCKGSVLGYIPRYFAKAINKCLKENYVTRCSIINMQKNSNCNECIYVCLEIE